MKFVNVASGTKNYCDYENDIVNLTRHSLISIISGLSQKEFGFDTMNRAVKEIQNYKNYYIDKYKSKLFIDSGGFSYIVGDIHPMNGHKLIECYHRYLLNEKETYDKIFSLDIPISLKYFEYNTTKYIYKFNKLSLSQSKDLLEDNPELVDKFYLVWHFKILKQYRIWSNIVNELGLNDIIKNRAIGGMVGLRGIVPIKFAPFIGMSYKLLYDFLTAKSIDSDFVLHLLGIYIRTDRFCIALLEQLFSKYLKTLNINHKAKITYDSINYMRTAQLKVKQLEYYDFVNNDLVYYTTQSHIPDHIYEHIYSKPQIIEEEQKKIDNNENISNIQAFVPLVVSSNINIDNFISHLIKKYEIPELIINSKNYNTFKNKVRSILLYCQQKYPTLFTSSYITNLQESFKYIYTFHNWFINDRKPQKLDVLMTKTISNINFPFDLEGNV